MALYIAKNYVFYDCTKHIGADCHFVRDAVTEGLISPSYFPTKFEFLLRKLDVRDFHAPT